MNKPNNNLELNLVVLQFAREPFESLNKTVTSGGTGGLDVPLAVVQRVQAQLLSDLGGVHGVGHILLVREDKDDSVAEVVLVEHALQLLTGLLDPIAVVRVNNEDKTLRILVIVLPKRADTVLSTDIPHGEGDVFVLNRFDVEADRGDGVHKLTKLQLEEDGGLTGTVETDHKNAHLLMAEEPGKQLRKRQTHIG